MTAHSCSRRPEDPCPARRPGMSCSLPRGHSLPHAKCVTGPGHAEHRAYEWWGYCHQEVVDMDGHLDACKAPACTSRIDDDGDEFPVCVDHQEPR